jgi:hypothetical protein
MKYHEISGIVAIASAVLCMATINPDPVKPHQAPTMSQLVNLAVTGEQPAREYYRKVLGGALKITGPIAIERDARSANIYWQPNIDLKFTGRDEFGVTTINSGETLIPDEILPAIMPENRGDGFPRDIPFTRFEVQ